MADVFFADEQSVRPVDGTRLCALAEHVLTEESIHRSAELSIMTVDRETMAGLNRRFMGRDMPTDVLAFPIEDDARGRAAQEEGEELPLLLGDVVVCPDVAFENVSGDTADFETELDLLVVHGVLHLLGYDHVQDSDAERMESRERELLDEFARIS
ncbi:MAG: rRNA maturation RNase YbeY [Acidimicrobiia bacterium]|nr:rRNA maturation RNase YbeY [Acidimicrobiia bacterium]